MSKSKPFTLGKYDIIIAVVPESCSGSGWSNAPIWVYVLNENAETFCHCIQPEHQTPVMQALFKTVAAGQSDMRREVARVFGGRNSFNA